MTRGTPSMGKHSKAHTHIRCRRCGNNTFHRRLDRCASCGYPDAKRRKYNWIKRSVPAL